MPGFANYGEYAAAAVNGQMSVCSFRKVPSQATVAKWWVDLSMAAGNPPPNYYASSPLVAATLDSFRGIFHGSDKTPSRKHLDCVTLQTPTAALVGQYILLDYLLYYPFVDGDESDVQVMDNSITLPRYTDGAGVQVMFVCVAPTAGGGQFTFTYVNQDGVTKTSPVHFYTTTAAGITSLLTSQPASNASFGPFLQLASGDSGVRSIVSFQNTVLNGGLGTLVMVKPLADLSIREINTPAEFSFADQRSPGPAVFDGAYLNLVMNCAASVAAGTLTGFGQFVWG